MLHCCRQTAFFQGSQKSIFKDSCDVYEVYESNKNLINDSELSQIALNIKEIIDICRITLDKHKEEKLRIFISVSELQYPKA